jgi:hypothetical protein
MVLASIPGMHIYFLSNASLNLPAISCKCKRVVGLGATLVAVLISINKLRAWPFNSE